ncbi:MAG TPA: formylglycine-generating enzyme family protein [Planctomycetota bacterium]|nr:formylglycine-generating enzyme family protein [Planctomycetota bacterium]
MLRLRPRSPERLLSRAAVLAATVLLAGLAVAADLPKRYTETITTKRGTKFSYEMVLIPGGKFTMGSPADEPGRKDHEGPQHKVELKPFYLCTTEVTLEQYNAFYLETHQKVKGLDPGRGDPLKEAEDALAPPPVDAITGPTPLTHVTINAGWGEGKQPAKMVTWFDAQIYCKWLWQKTGRKHRLPTEAEWEYACRAGTTTRYFFGDDPAKLDDYAWFDDNCSGDTGEQMTHPAGEKKPNPWGLYDMLGNVREWVLDFYSPTAYADNAKAKPCVNPRGPATGKYHVARGGFYDNPPADLRCAARAFEEDWWKKDDPLVPRSRWFLPYRAFIGFRIAREIEDK